MKILGWDKKYEIGVKKIDEQNKIMLALLNKMMKIYLECDYNSDYLRVYATILTYARKFFEIEEKLMHDIKYGQFTLHKNQHEEFIHKMEFFNNEYMQGENVVFEFQRYIQRWFDAHIQIADKKFVPHIHRNYAVKAEFALT